MTKKQQKLLHDKMADIVFGVIKIGIWSFVILSFLFLLIMIWEGNA